MPPCCTAGPSCNTSLRRPAWRPALVQLAKHFKKTLSADEAFEKIKLLPGAPAAAVVRARRGPQEQKQHVLRGGTRCWAGPHAAPPREAGPGAHPTATIPPVPPRLAMMWWAPATQQLLPKICPSPR